jgi:hypothetical protein
MPRRIGIILSNSYFFYFARWRKGAFFLVDVDHRVLFRIDDRADTCSACAMSVRTAGMRPMGAARSVRRQHENGAMQGGPFGLTLAADLIAGVRRMSVGQTSRQFTPACGVNRHPTRPVP